MEYSKLNGETSFRFSKHSVENELPQDNLRSSQKPTINKQLGDGDDSHKIVSLYIKYVPSSFTPESFEALLSKFGKIISVYIGKPNQKYANSHLVFSIVKVSTMRDAISIMENVHRKPPLNLSVEFAKTGEKVAFSAPKSNFMSTSFKGQDPDVPKRLQNEFVEEARISQHKERTNDTFGSKTNDTFESRTNNTFGSSDRGDTMEGKTASRKCKCIKCDAIGLKRCSVCKAWYCSKECQLDDWYYHQERCRPPPPLEDICDEPAVNEKIAKMCGNSTEGKIMEKEAINIVDGCDHSSSEHFSLTQLMKKKDYSSSSQTTNEHKMSPSIVNKPVPRIRKFQDEQKVTNEHAGSFSQQVDVISLNRAPTDQKGYSSKQVMVEKMHNKKISSPANLDLTEIRSSISSIEQKVTLHPDRKESSELPLDARIELKSSETNIVGQQRKRFMKGELYIDHIEIGSTYTVLPIWNEGDTLYVRLEDKGDLLEEMVAHLLQYCPNAVVPDSLVKGEIICVYHSEDDIWYRAEVLKLQGDEVLIHYIDFGNTSLIPVKYTRVCDATVIKIPIFAIPVKLIDECNEKEKIDILDLLIEEQTLVLMDVKVLDPDIEVELWNIEKTKKILPEIPWVKAEENEEATVESSTALKLLKSGEVKPKVSMYDECKPTSLPLEKNVEVVVLQPTNPLCFFIAPKASLHLYEELEVLSLQMNDYCNSLVPTHYEPKEGEICLAKYSADDLWYRACCVMLDRGCTDMIFVDYGNQEKVPFKNICQMVDRFLEIPLLALHCQIIGFTWEDIKIGGTKLEEIFQKILSPNSVQFVNVMSKCEDSHVYQIEIPTLKIEDIKRAAFT